ncbi:hypothetical protein FB451DRAFT_1527729 [Mycena latifolia]|nr:hypothetical protein FB451DRAFT_1527729 [Mycena latifolia]
MDPLSNLGGCTSSECKAGCGIFVPDTSGETPAHPAMVKCAICGHFAGQHIRPFEVTLGNGPARAVPAQSATHNTMFGSREHVPNASAAPGGTKEKLSGPFRSAAQVREDIIDEARLHPLNSVPGSKPFNPAAKSHIEGDLNPHDSSSKKRKRKSAKKSDPTPIPDTGTPAGAPSGSQAFDVVLVEGTKPVAQDRYRRPGADKLLSLAARKYVRRVYLRPHSAAADIERAVLAKFADIPAVGQFGFRPLNVKKATYTTQRGKQSKRVEFRLRASQLPLDMESWTRATTLASPPGAKGFKNIVYIALRPTGPNLPYPGSDISATKPTSDQESRMGGSDESDDSDENTDAGNGHGDDGAGSGNAAGPQNEFRSTTSKSTGVTEETETKPASPLSSATNETANGKEKAGTEDESGADATAENDFGDNESTGSRSWENEGHWGEDTSDWKPYPPVHAELLRLLQNMAKPESGKDSTVWWKSTTMEHFKPFNGVLPLIAEIFDLAKNGQLAVDVCLEKIKKHILLPFDEIRIITAFVAYPDTADPILGLENFDNLVAIGPGGIPTVLPAFNAVYEGLADLRTKQILTDNAKLVESEVKQMSDNLLTCLRHLRSKYFRGLYDPKGGFREFVVLLNSPAAARILPHGRAGSDMVRAVDLISLKWDSTFILTSCLESAFGDSSDPRKMRYDFVTQGEFGLLYFYHTVIVPLLDDLDREDYTEIYSILLKCCSALARKVRTKGASRAECVPATQVCPMIFSPVLNEESFDLVVLKAEITPPPTRPPKFGHCTSK